MQEAEVQQRARGFVAGVDTSNIRNDLSVYTKAANAKVVEEALGQGESGTTLTRPDGKHVITVNSLESEVRRRFTICHEVAHIILELPSRHDEVPSWSYVKRDPNEICCDIFAAELLMPYKLWKAQVPKGEPSIEVIEQMAKEFKASFPAAASRYAQLADIPCAFVSMEGGTIRYAARSTSLRHTRAWIPLRSAIPVGSVAHRLREEGVSQIDTAEVAQDVWFENWEKGSELWEIARHYRSYDTTVSLLWFEDDELSKREADRFGVRVAEDEGLAELIGELPWPGKSKRK